MKPSIVRAKLATLAASLVRYRPGRVSPAELAEIDKRLRNVLGL